MISELRRSEERYALAVRGANDGIWDWDLVGGTRLLTSERWKPMLGHSEAEIGDSPDEWFELVHPDDRDRLQREIDHHLDGDSPHFESEHRIRHADGELALGAQPRAGGPRPPTARRRASPARCPTSPSARQREERLSHDALHDA